MISADHPTLDRVESRDRARAAAKAFVRELQRGLDAQDAIEYNAHFAADVLWGGPFGAIVDGYDDLHAIHRRLHAAGVAARSRYELVHVRAVASDVAVAQVRRVPLEPDRPDSTAEVVLLVLVERDGTWWLAAGQNTLVQPGRSADGT